MAAQATMHHVEVALSDVDRGVYEALDLRVAQHPSESMRYMLTRTLAYCLSYEEGIAFSKGGLSSTDEAPISVKDPTGVLLAWIDIGSRAHSKAVSRTFLASSVFITMSSADLAHAMHRKYQTKTTQRIAANLIERGRACQNIR